MRDIASVIGHDDRIVSIMIGTDQGWDTIALRFKDAGNRTVEFVDVLWSQLAMNGGFAGKETVRSAESVYEHTLIDQTRQRLTKLPIAQEELGLHTLTTNTSASELRVICRSVRMISS